MHTQFILDTNAYRQLAENKYLGEIMGLANDIRHREREHDSRSLMSVMVSMELLKHFDETDPHFMSSFKGLVLQYFHTQVKHNGDPNNKIDFIPPINPILTQHFFSSGSEYLKLYFRVIEIVENATKNAEPEDFRSDIDDIAKIKEQLLHEKTEIKNNFESFLKFVNSGVLDWEFFKNNAPLRKKLFSDIKSGKMLDTMAEAQIVRAHAVMDLSYPQPGLENKRRDFRHYYEPLLKINQSFFEKMLLGVTALGDPNNHKWNTLHDSYLLAAACYASFKEKDNNWILRYIVYQLFQSIVYQRFSV